MKITDQINNDKTNLIEMDFGIRPLDVDLDRQFLDWLHYKARTIPTYPRKVIVAREADSFRKQFPTITTIEITLSEGGDIRPWLSNTARTRQSDPKADMLFNDWKIIHFHLSDVLASPDAVQRTNELLFAYVCATHAVLLTVKPHKNSFALQEYLQILNRTSPSDMSSSEVKGISDLEHHLNDEEIFNLRKKGGNAFIKIGRRFFTSPGQGIVSSQHAFRLVRYRDVLMSAIQHAHRSLAAGSIGANWKPAPPMINVEAALGLRYQDGIIHVREKIRNIDLVSMHPIE